MWLGAHTLSALSATIRALDLPAELAQFSAMMREQLDLRREGRTLARFSRNFRHSRLPVRFPKVLFAGGDVLVEELVEADAEGGVVKMTDFLQTCTDKGLRERVARAGIRSFLKMVFWDNFVHADLHPGNMIVRVSDNTHADPATNFTLVFLDTGLVTELGASQHDNLVRLFKALVVDGDGEEAGRLMLTRYPQTPTLHDPSGFTHKIGRICEPLLQARFRLDRSLSLGPILLSLMSAVREHNVRLDPAFTNLIWSVVCVEGLGRQLAPDMQLQPLVFQAVVQFLASQALRDVCI
jgi:aarF domain-containing kinase